MKLKVINKPVIVVLGMHSSSTSLTTRALQVPGVDLGGRLISPYWGDIDINDFDNALLEKVGSSWNRLKILDESVQTHNQSVSK